ncbi:MAG: response regulator [Deltaproteobacteria bacterium]|nr:response regulator [Deltaproteobacteria bacterium]
MAEDRFNNNGHKKFKFWCPMRGYASKIGLKVAIPVAIFMFAPFLGYVFFHEYVTEGWSEMKDVLLFPPFWGAMAVAFIGLMAILSKVVILPLKRFEQHLSELEKGIDTGPLELQTNDEIGYLVGRFNKLHNVIAGEIKSRDVHLDVIYGFMDASSGVFDTASLMDNFFKTLAAAVDYDVGAYILCGKNLSEGRIYSTHGLLDDKDAQSISERLFTRAGSYCEFSGKEQMPALNVYPISNGADRTRKADTGLNPLRGPAEGHIIEQPLLYNGKPIGVIILISYSSGGIEIDKVFGAKVFNAMVQHANVVIEGLLNHLSAEERRLADILSSMSEGVFLIDRNGHTTSINKKGLELVSGHCKHGLECGRAGFAPDIGNCPHTYADICDFSKILKKVREIGPALDGKVITEEINDNGQILQVSTGNLKTAANRKEGFVVTVKDVTEDRLIQKRIMLSSKLAALGEMAAGIAHEVNNPLQVMMANIELLEGSVLDREPKEIKRIDHIKDGIFRIKTIVRDLLIFAREQTTEVEDIDVNRLIEKAVDLMRHQLKQAGVRVNLELDARPIAVRCNRNLFQQVIINLLQNAKDAIEESQKGSLVRIGTEVLPSGLVTIEVADDGPGIPEKVIDRIFDPFFTTKDVGKGTGLGLSVSRRIIEGMGGNIAVAGSPSSGTVFTITLILSDVDMKKTNLLAVSEAMDYKLLAGKSIIIVDDEEGVVKAVRDSVGPHVLSVETALTGVDAVAAIMDRDFDLILLDIKMPGMSGMEVFRCISDVKPYLADRVIFVTGDTESESTDSFIKITGCRHLSKPFSTKALLDSMCEYEMETMEREVG